MTNKYICPDCGGEGDWCRCSECGECMNTVDCTDSHKEKEEENSMTKFSEYYLVIKPDGTWRGLCYSYPPKALEEFEIMLTYKEYKLLKELKSLEQGFELLNSVGDKISLTQRQNEQTE